MGSPFFARIAHAFLGPADSPQRLRTAQTLLVLAIMVVFAGVQHIEVMFGLVNPVESAWLSAAYLSGALAFYLITRSGLNLKYTRDPSLSVPQMVFGVLAAVGSYIITGPARGAIMSLMVLILVYGMFALRAKQARRLALFACTLMGSAMLWNAYSDPERYPPQVEAVHLLFAIITVVSVTILTARMSAIRERMRSQRTELESALAQNRHLATRDELTGLLNRRHMVDLLDAEKSRQRRTGKSMSVALLDIDWFKRVNDTYGHSGGDLALKTFAQLTRGGLRSMDVMSRWGGEEFLLMLPETSIDEAVQCVERVRSHLARMSADAIAPRLRVTFSAGVSAVAPDDNIEAAIERADQAMYRAKVQGRNCTVVG